MLPLPTLIRMAISPQTYLVRRKLWLLSYDSAINVPKDVSLIFHQADLKLGEENICGCN